MTYPVTVDFSKFCDCGKHPANCDKGDHCVAHYLDNEFGLFNDDEYRVAPVWGYLFGMVFLIIAALLGWGFYFAITTLFM